MCVVQWEGETWLVQGNPAHLHREGAAQQAKNVGTVPAVHLPGFPSFPFVEELVDEEFLRMDLKGLGSLQKWELPQVCLL